MTDLTIDDSFFSQLQSLIEPAVLRNAEGRIVGHFIPAIVPTDDGRNPRISEAELDRREREGGGRPLAEWIADSEKQQSHDNAGLVDWLLACPEKGWFTPIPSESTAEL